MRVGCTADYLSRSIRSYVVSGPASEQNQNSQNRDDPMKNGHCLTPTLFTPFFPTSCFWSNKFGVKRRPNLRISRSTNE
mgnify:CR=1 FL=1